MIKDASHSSVATRQKATPALAGGDSLRDWIQLFIEGFVDEHPVMESAGGDSTQDKELKLFVLLTDQTNASQQASTMCLLTFLRIRIAQPDQNHACQVSEST